MASNDDNKRGRGREPVSMDAFRGAVRDLRDKAAGTGLTGFDPAISSGRPREEAELTTVPEQVPLAPLYRRLGDGRVWVWKNGWGQKAYVLYSMLGLDGGIETALRAQAKIPVRTQTRLVWTSQADEDEDETSDSWAAFVPAISSLQFAKDVVNGVMHGKTKRGSAITDLEALARATTVALRAAFSGASFEMQVYVILLVQIYFTSLQLVVEPENEVAFTEERPRIEVTTLPEAHFAIMCGATANAAISVLTKSMAALPEWVMVDIVQSGLQRFLDAFVRARANYYQYVQAFETILGMVRFSLASGAEPVFASTSQAYCLLRSNACALRMAQSTRDLPAPPMVQTERWIEHSELALDALDVMEYELEAIERPRHVQAYSAFRDRSGAFFSLGPAGIGERPSIARTAPAGTPEVLSLTAEHAYDSGVQSCWNALKPIFSEQLAARVPAAYSASVQGRYGWTDVCSVGVGSQIILALSLCESFQTFHPGAAGLKKVRPDAGFSPEAIGQYMSREIIFGYIVAGSSLGYQGHDPKVIGSALGTVASPGLLTTFSPYAAIRASMPGGIGQPLREEEHLGTILQKPRPVRLLAGSAVARAQLDMREWLDFRLRVVQGDNMAVMPVRSVRMGRFLFGDVVLAQDERLWLVGPLQQHPALWHSMMTHYTHAADAVAIGKRRSYFKSVVAEPLRQVLLSDEWAHQITEMAKKIAAYASRYSTEIDVAATIGVAARAAAAGLFLDIVNLNEIGQLLTALLSHEDLQICSEVQDAVRARLAKTATFTQA